MEPEATYQAEADADVRAATGGRPGWLKDPVTAAIVHLRHQNTVNRAPYFLRLADEAEESYAVMKDALAVAERERDEAREALRRADDFISDPDGAPIESLNLAHKVIRAALAGGPQT